MKKLWAISALTLAQTAYSAELEGFKTLKFGMSEQEISEQGFNCNPTADAKRRICSSYDFSKLDANNKNYARSGVTVFENAITNASVQFNQNNQAHYISLGVAVNNCHNVLATMRVTLGAPQSTRTVEPDLNKKQTVTIRGSEWRVEGGTISHSYMDLGIRSVGPSCDVTFRSSRYQDQPQTPKASKDF
jgi:hypothetical protein